MQKSNRKCFDFNQVLLENCKENEKFICIKTTRHSSSDADE